MAACNRRTRLIRFLIEYGPSNGIKVGRLNYPWGYLTDDALEEFASEAASAFWAQRRSSRISRAHYASMRAA